MIRTLTVAAAWWLGFGCLWGLAALGGGPATVAVEGDATVYHGVRLGGLALFATLFLPAIVAGEVHEWWAGHPAAGLSLPAYLGRALVAAGSATAVFTVAFVAYLVAGFGAEMGPFWIAGGVGMALARRWTGSVLRPEGA